MTIAWTRAWPHNNKSNTKREIKLRWTTPLQTQTARWTNTFPDATNNPDALRHCKTATTIKPRWTAAMRSNSKNQMHIDNSMPRHNKQTMKSRWSTALPNTTDNQIQIGHHMARRNKTIKQFALQHGQTKKNSKTYVCVCVCVCV